MPTWNAIYLGQHAIIDPTEGNTTSENASALVGQTFGGAANRLAGHITSVTTFDTNGDGALNQDNNLANERFTADIGNGVQSFTFDAVASYRGTITYIDGTTATMNMVIFQDTSGRTFLAPSLDATSINLLTQAQIQSITLNSVVQSTGVQGLAVARPSIDFLPCFVAGTLIATPYGDRRVEDIAPGDVVMTRDNGVQTVRWAGCRRVPGTADFAPIRFAPGAFGNARALLVSPQHRVLVTGWRAELYCGEDEVLVAATHLVNGDTICRVPMPQVSYHHFMFNTHQVVISEGIATESFHPGDHILLADVAIRAELEMLFPELNGANPGRMQRTVRKVARGAEARMLAMPEARAA